MYANAFHTKDLSTVKVLITGGAGFIGSNLVEYLLKYNIGHVRVLDNLSNGYKANIEPFVGQPNFEFIEGDIRDLPTCQKACEGMDYVLHQAALGSVPRSINDPITTNEVNISGFLNMLVAVKDQKVKRMVYAASSSTYGDSKELPKVEDKIGKPLSPYAVTKVVNEIYADVFAKTYGLETIGLRYFNVFGPRQSPNGAYAAVIPLFMQAVKKNKPATINGDGGTTRDFTFVENVVQANIKAMLVDKPEAVNQIYNVACGERISLNELWENINKLVGSNIKAIYLDPRIGDIRDSLASIEKIKTLLNYVPSNENGLKITYEKF
jgi:UDP-N-acetylglucosamine/UDP-N-acetylgalactosamine 4-epimerase